MNVSVASHAHRKLRQLERYRSASAIVQNPPACLTLIPTLIETIVGCYRNDGGSATDWIVFTTDGISAMFDGIWGHIPYAEITGIVREDVKNVDTDEVCLKLRSQTCVSMLVSGKNVDRGTHDKYSIMMFLESVVAHA
jgi:hypothetical protein